ncbi:polymeric immunoglobulin receptor-like isoform X2 [Silurus asotus]|nr:polymeric immunoglobulin receptor-like isoform X2 [Silurus asotus]
MILLLIFILCMISDGGASNGVTGYSGGRVIIKCKYDTDYTQNLNYFCKDSCSNCSVATEDINKWVHFWERFLLFDDTKSAEIRVMIRELSKKDPGTYQCGFIKSWGTNICTPVKLNIQLDAQEVLSKCVQAGEDLELSCKYTEKVKKVCKFICTMQQEHSCSSILSGQLSLHNDTEGLALSVSIGKLHEKDSGKYSGEAEVFFTIIILAVDDLSYEKSISKIGYIGRDLDIICKYPQSVRRFPAFTMFTVSVVLLLLLIGISILNVILKKRCKMPDLSYEKSIIKTVHVGGDLNISCKYPQCLRNHAKFLCKRLQPAACIYSESVTESRKDVNVGKFSLYDDRTEQIFTVSIRNVAKQDSGEYWCGAEADWTSDHGYKVYFTQISLTVTDGENSKEVTGYSEGEILIKCKYDTEYTQNRKKFCKGSSSGCSDLIKTRDKNMWVTSERFSLFDDTKSAEISVMIRELTVEDTGTYQCGVDKSRGMYIYLPVELQVQEDLSYEKSINNTVHVGGDLTISCKYPQSLTSDPKFLCKRMHPAACVYKESVTESKKYVNFGKFFLYDDRTEQIFTVSIRNAAKTDSGEYWCGAEAAWTSDHGYKVYFTQISLTVTGEIVET